MSAFRMVLGSAAVLAASACSGSNEIDAPNSQPLDSGGSVATGGPGTTTGAGTTSGASAGTDGSGVGGATAGSTSGSNTASTNATMTTGDATSSTTGMGGTTAESTTSQDTGTDATGGSTSTGGAFPTGNATSTGFGFGGAANDGGGNTTSGAGGQTSTDECRVMLGDVPVCCTPQGENRANVDEVFELLNAYRISQGRDALAQDPVLEETMQGHCMHMDQADFFDHISPVSELAEPWDRADLCGTNANAENIAYNQRSPAAVMEAWQNSSGHNQNMLTNNSTRVGIGEYNLYWGQIFGP